MLEQSQNYSRQNGDMKQLPYWGSRNIRRQHTNFSRPGFVHPCCNLYFQV